MDPGAMVFVAIIVISIARTVYLQHFSRRERLRRRLRRRAHVAIAEARDGLVRLVGRVHPTGEILSAPVSQRPCVAFHLVVGKGDGEDGWRTVLELEDARPFVLADETGQAVIDVAAGPFSISLVPDRNRSSPPFRSEPESADLLAVRSLLRSQNIETETFLGHQVPLQFSEAVLSPGSDAAVGGSCAREVALDGERAGYRDVPQRLVVRGTEAEPLLISNWREALEKPYSNSVEN